MVIEFNLSIVIDLKETLRKNDDEHKKQINDLRTQYDNRFIESERNHENDINRITQNVEELTNLVNKLLIANQSLKDEIEKLKSEKELIPEENKWLNSPTDNSNNNESNVRGNEEEKRNSSKNENTDRDPLSNIPITESVYFEDNKDNDQ